MAEGLYDSAALLLSKQGEVGFAGEHRALTPATSVRQLFLRLAGHLLASVET